MAEKFPLEAPSKLADLEDKIFEEVKPLYVSPDLNIPYKMYRKDELTGGRFYFSNGTPYISSTNLIDKMIPKGEGFKKWLMNKGYESQAEMVEKAEFGTIFHIICTNILRDDTGFDFDKTRQILGDMADPKFHINLDSWVYSFKKGIASYLQFLNDYMKGFILIEGPLKSTTVNVAATLDLVAMIKYRKAEKLAIIDLKSFLNTIVDKSSKKTFYESHGAQLGIQKQIFNENFPEIPVELLYNWAPNNFIGDKATYTFEVQHTDKNPYNNPKSLEYLYKLAELRGVLKPPKEVADILGEVPHWKQFDFSKHSFKITV